jgi:hypothetical protein
MRVHKTVPQQETQMDVVSIIFQLQDKVVTIVMTEGSDVKPMSISLTNAFDELAPQNKTLVKAFLKKVVEKCAGVSATDIEGEVLESK